MKKIVIVLFVISLTFILTKKEEDILIPEDAIRFRVIANGNSTTDQIQKNAIKRSVEEEVYQLIERASSTADAQNIILDNMDKIEEVVKGYDTNFTINYGTNYFPTKNYKGVLYPAGNYQSLVITLGEGDGGNFWCVLFPPLCLIEQDKEDIGEVEYQFYVRHILDKF